MYVPEKNFSDLNKVKNLAILIPSAGNRKLPKIVSVIGKLMDGKLELCWG